MSATTHGSFPSTNAAANPRRRGIRRGRGVPSNSRSSSKAPDLRHIVAASDEFFAGVAPIQRLDVHGSDVVHERERPDAIRADQARQPAGQMLPEQPPDEIPLGVDARPVDDPRDDADNRHAARDSRPHHFAHRVAQAPVVADVSGDCRAGQIGRLIGAGRRRSADAPPRQFADNDRPEIATGDDLHWAPEGEQGSVAAGVTWKQGIEKRLPQFPRAVLLTDLQGASID